MKKSCDQSCKKCEEWEEHFFWNHMDNHKMHFFKVMVEDFTQSMTMPKKFANRFGGQISEVVDLKLPSGNVWQVGVTKPRGDMVLLSGWKEFIDAHRVEENDLLLFKFSGNSSFEVLIFDAGGYEKASSYFAKKKDPQMRESNEGSAKFINVGTLRKVIDIDSSSNSADDIVKPEMPRNPSGAFHGVERAGLNRSTASTGTNLETIHLPKRPRGRPRKYVGSSRDIKYERKSESQESGDRKQETPCIGPYFSARSLQLTPSQDQKVSKLALALRPNPCFAAIMYPSNTTIKNCFLNFPKSFAVAHLPQRSERIILKLPNKTPRWTCSYIFTRHLRGIYGGWSNFVRDNNLRKGDVCLFELMKDRKILVLTVHSI